MKYEDRDGCWATQMSASQFDDEFNHLPLVYLVYDRMERTADDAG